MKKVQLYINQLNDNAKFLAKLISEELAINGYEIVEENADIVIGFGGDGTLLHFLRTNNYQIQSQYIGVNCGTLGFLQDFNVEEVHSFVKNIPYYVKQRLNFVVVEVNIDDEKNVYKALNEFTIQNAQNKSFRAKVCIGEEFLENFVGTGIIFSTPTGSTALNLSAGGTILHPEIEAIQITPREAISNSKMHCLSKSVCIPNGWDIILNPNTKDRIKIYSDGEMVYYGIYDSIKVYYSNEGMFKLKDKKDSFIQTIREKLI